MSGDVTDMEQRQDVIGQLENCINHLQSWMVTNKLKVNGNKIELVLLVSTLMTCSGNIDKNLNDPSVSAKNLGVCFA